MWRITTNFQTRREGGATGVLASMRFAVSFDMLDPALCVAWRILKLLLKAVKTLVTVSLELDAGTAQQY